MGSSLALGTDGQDAVSLVLVEGVGELCTGRDDTAKRRNNRRVESILRASVLDMKAAMQEWPTAVESGRRVQIEVEKVNNQGELRGQRVDGRVGLEPLCS